MRTIVFFDLPTVSFKDRKNYQKFRKFLISEGFIMMQESVYSKICINQVQNENLCKRVRINSPKKGKIQMLSVTELQYSNIEYIIGKPQSSIIDTEERLIII